MATATDTTRRVWAQLACGCEVNTPAGVLARCPNGHEAHVPDHRRPVIYPHRRT